MVRRWRVSGLLVAFALVIGMLAGPAPLGPSSVHAVTINVTTTNDEFVADGDCSLREAIVAANSNANQDQCLVSGAGPHTISIPDGTYTLTIAGKNENIALQGDLDINVSVNIVGAGPGRPIIRASATDASAGVDRVFDVCGDILNCPNPVNVTMTNLEIRNGNPASGGNNGGGGGVFTNGTSLTLTNVIVTANTAGNGGGVFVAGGRTFTATDSTFSSNVAAGQPPPNGGGDGGGLFLDFNTTATIDRSTISANSAASNVAMVSPLGAGIFDDGTLTLTNSTLSGNTITSPLSPGRGGGLFVFNNSATLNNVTLNGNSVGAPGSGGNLHRQGGTLSIGNTIVANAGAGGDCSGTIVSQGFNLDTDGSCALANTGDQPNTPLTLDPLASNGGPTQTHALQPGSAAIDRGNPAAPLDGGLNGTVRRCLSVDQRNVARPIDGDGNSTAVCDVGAFKAPAPGAPTPTPTPSPTATPTATPPATATPTATPIVPELSTVLMFGTGLAGLGSYALVRARARRRR